MPSGGSGLLCPLCARFERLGHLTQIGSGRQGRRYRCLGCGLRMTIDRQTFEDAARRYLMLPPVTAADG